MRTRFGCQRSATAPGNRLMKTIIMDLIDADVSTVHLWPTKGKVSFYEGLAFQAVPGEQPIMVLDKSVFNTSQQDVR